MTKKILTDLNAAGRTITATTFAGNATTATSVGNSLVLKADTGTTEGTDLYTFNGSATKTLNIVAGSNITITKTSGQWSIASTGGGGSGFTGAGTSITGIAGTNVNGGSGSITGSNIILTTGTAITSQDVDPEISNNATSGNLYLKSGDATGFTANSGNVYIETGATSANGEYGYGVNGNVLIGGGNTKAVGIGWTDTTGYTVGGATTVNIMDRSSTASSKELNLATNGNSTINIGTTATNTGINIGTSATSTTVKIATSASTTGVIQIGTNATLSSTYLFGKKFVWQPLGGTASIPTAPTVFIAAATLTAANILTFIIQYTGASGAGFTLPTGASMDSGVQNSFTATGIEWTFMNTNGGTVTLGSPGSNHIIIGSGTIATNVSARFLSVRSTTNVWATFRIS